MSGPLTGVSVVELAGLGPGPFAGMVLADLGARVIRIDRPTAVPSEVPLMSPVDVLERGKRSVALNLKTPEGVELLLRLVERADGFIDPYRPGVVERLGIGPEVCLGRRPSLVYGRMTGWGQSGPYASMAGHDINYIAISGVLDAIGRAGGPPTPPLNVVGDFGGGGMLLVIGLLAGIVEARSSGTGQVVDAAMIDGAALLSSVYFGSSGLKDWREERGTNLVDSGAPFYDVYRTADDRYVSIGAIEPQFFAELVRRLGLRPEEMPDQHDRSGWPAMRSKFKHAFAERTLEAWCVELDGTDVCFAPVLTFSEAPRHPQNVHRDVFVSIDGRVQPAPAPRFERTPAVPEGAPPHPGENTAEVLSEIGVAERTISSLARAGIVRACPT